MRRMAYVVRSEVFSMDVVDGRWTKDVGEEVSSNITSTSHTDCFERKSLESITCVTLFREIWRRRLCHEQERYGELNEK